MGLLGQFTTALLVFVFCASGAVKLTDKINPEVHEHMKREFVRYAKVHPLTIYFNYKVDPVQYIQVIGWVELVCGVLLVTGPRILKVLSSLICMKIMIGALFTLYTLKEPLQMMTPASVTFVLLCVNLALMFQREDNVDQQKKSE